MEIRTATSGDLDAVIAVLDDCADWLRRRGLRQWPESFSAGWLAPAVEAGEVWVAEVEGAAVGTFALTWSDPVVWGDTPDADDAGYVHQLAVARAAAGRGYGDALLGRAGELVAARGRGLLRLDCVAFNVGLRRYYESRGFVHCGNVTDLPRREPAWRTASRYQRPADRLHSR